MHIYAILIINNSFIKYLKGAFIAEIRREFHKLMPRHSSFEIRKEKTFMKKKNNVLFFTLVICTVMTVFTCKQNVGLGGTVDIERPE